MFTAEEAQKVIAAPLTGNDDVKLGTVQEILVNGSSGEPEWLLIAVGTYGDTHRLVPADQASVAASGLHVPYSRELFTDAPETDTESETPTADEAATLYQHYGVNRQT